MRRRQFLARSLSTVALAAGLPFAGACRRRAEPRRSLMTVTGELPIDEVGLMLPHEHVIVSLSVPGPYDRSSPDLEERYRYDREEVIRVALPHLQAAVRAGVKTMAELTPAYLGRDPIVLRRLSEATGLRILTNTGYYGARDDRHLPPHALTESVDDLAARWTREWRDGIEGTGVRPGFIKIGVDGGPLSDVDAKLVRAAARTHAATGLTIAAHTGPAAGAWDEIAILEDEGVHPSAWIWVHAQAEPDLSAHVEAANQGAWVEFDGVAEGSIEQHVELVVNMREHGRLDRTLVSHDAGWYRIGEPGGGEFRGYTELVRDLIPALRKAGLSEQEVHQLTRVNPAAAYGVRRGSDPGLPPRLTLV